MLCERNQLIAMVLLSFARPALALSPETIEALNASKCPKIIQYTDMGAESGLIILDSGTKNGIVNGEVFNVFRNADAADIAAPGLVVQSQKVWIETGKIKVVRVYDAMAIGKVVDESSDIARALFPKFPGVMAGDLVAADRPEIAHNIVLMPEKQLPYMDLFEDPKSHPGTYELSEAGKVRLTDMVQEFAKAKLSTLMVQGFTDEKGAADANQIESYQRALTVRQYLIRDLGFDESRVVALGFGETEPIAEKNTPNQERLNRRIVIKAVSGAQ